MYVGGGQYFIEPHTLPTAGSYTVRTTALSEGAGSLTLALYPVPADLTGAIVPGGASVTKATTAFGQNVRLTFAGVAGQRVSVRVSRVTMSAEIRLLQPDNTLVGYTFVVWRADS